MRRVKPGGSLGRQGGHCSLCLKERQWSSHPLAFQIATTTLAPAYVFQKYINYISTLVALMNVKKGIYIYALQ
jgi:hypothetical protein